MLALRCALLACAGAAAITAGARAAVLIPIPPVPNSSTTLAFGINDNNVIAGSFISAQDGIEHGYFGVPGGTYTTFDAGAGGTEARGINNNGYITGYSNSQNGSTSSWPIFERLPSGKLLKVEANGQPVFGRAQGINNSQNRFAGTYWDSGDHEAVAFIGQKGKYLGDVTIPDEHQASDAEAINNKDVVVGSYFQPPSHGFIGSGNNLVTIDYPGQNVAGTSMEGINDSGQAVGQWADTKGKTHSFLLDIASNTFTDIEVPGSKNVQAWAINNSGEVVVDSDIGAFIWCAKKKQCPTGGAAGAAP